ncbi:MAG TPA: hypothetical protein VH439_03945 [Gemmatimonadales bacterium]|jgi:hypothetical protein
MKVPIAKPVTVHGDVETGTRLEVRDARGELLAEFPKTLGHLKLARAFADWIDAGGADDAVTR